MMAQKKLEHSRNDIDLRNKSTYAHFYFSPYTNVLLEEDHGDANLEEGSPSRARSKPHDSKNNSNAANWRTKTESYLKLIMVKMDESFRVRLGGF